MKKKKVERNSIGCFIIAGIILVVLWIGPTGSITMEEYISYQGKKWFSFVLFLALGFLLRHFEKKKLG
jgi:hypothetical protein